MTPEVMGVWGRLLKRVPGSRLLLKNKPFACQAAQQDYLRRVSRLAASRCRLGRVHPAPRLHAAGRGHPARPVTQHCAAQLAEQDVDTQQVDLVGLHPDTGSHLGSYAAVDIALDPWPYAGTTTTAEALLMGVPLVTLAGKRLRIHMLGADPDHLCAI